MSILSTLYLVFKGDNKDALEKAKQTEQAQDRVTSAVSRSSKAARFADNEFLNLGRSLASLGAGVLSTVGIVAGIKSAVEYAQQLDLISRQLHISVSDLDAWSGAVKRTGGSVQSFESSIQSLAQHLGVTNATALKLLPALADSFQKIGYYRSQNYGKTLGLDQSTILLLQQGSREVNALLERQKQLGVVTQRDAIIARNFGFALQDTQRAFRGVWLELADKVLPLLDKFTDKILLPVAQVFREHSDLIVGGLIAISGAAIIAGFSLGILSLPVILITASMAALIGLFALAYDDIHAFFNDQDSLIGRAIKQWETLTDKVKSYVATISPAFRHLMGIDEVQGANPDFGQQYLAPSADDLENAKGILSQASNSPLNALSTPSILSTPSLANSNVSIAEINIQTQATDADGIAGALEKGIREHLWQANSNSDDGLTA